MKCAGVQYTVQALSSAETRTHRGEGSIRIVDAFGWRGREVLFKSVLRRQMRLEDDETRDG